MTSTTWRNKALVASAGVLCALVATGGAADAAVARARGAGPLQDLQLSTVQPTDGATAQVVARESGGSTTVTLKVQALDHAAAGKTLGAHVHVGPCVAGNGAIAGPHYNAGGGPSPTTEVWLDFTIDENGTAHAEATVPFTIAAGAAASVVIHASPTSTTGAAGPRLACLPVQF